MDEKDGVWVAFAYDIGPYPQEMFPGNDEGKKEGKLLVETRGYGDLAWWPFGTPFHQAVEAHELRSGGIL